MTFFTSPHLLNPFPFPADITGLRAWFRGDGTKWADVARTTPVTTTIGAWDDDSSNANHAIQATSSRRPQTGASINGIPTVRFDGTSDFLTTTVEISDTLASVFTVVKPQQTPSAVYRGLYSADGVGIYTALAGSSGQWGTYQATDQSYGGTLTSGTSYVLSLVKRATNDIDLSQNGVVVNKTGGGADDPRNASTIGAGDPTTPSQWAQIDLAELSIYNSALSTTNRNRVKNYLANKYNITVS